MDNLAVKLLSFQHIKTRDWLIYEGLYAMKCCVSLKQNLSSLVTITCKKGGKKKTFQDNVISLGEVSFRQVLSSLPYCGYKLTRPTFLSLVLSLMTFSRSSVMLSKLFFAIFNRVFTTSILTVSSASCCRDLICSVKDKCFKSQSE